MKDKGLDIELWCKISATWRSHLRSSSLAYKAARAEFCKLKQTNVEHNVYTFKEEHKVQVFENKKIFGHKWLKYMGNKKKT